MRWLPDGMGFVTEASTDDQGDASEASEAADGSVDADGSGSDDPEHELPAFLSDNAA